MSDRGQTQRPGLDVTHPLRYHEWLVREVGGPQLPGFFVREGELVRVPLDGQDGYRPLSDHADDHDGPAQVRAADTAVLRAVLARRYRPFRMEQEKKPDGPFIEREVLPPIDPTGLYIAGVGEQGTAAPVLRGVAHSPFLRPDGSVVNHPGYDQKTRMLYLPPPGLNVGTVPARPTKKQIAAARDLLLRLVGDFPFVSEDDRASYIGALLLATPLRAILRPPYPGIALTAHMAGSGKTLLGQVAIALHGGVLRSEPSQKDDEIRKLITSILHCTSSPLIVLDNLTGTFRSGQYAALLTSPRWSDRPLGATAQVEAPNDRLWVVTGNNVSLGGDLPRRIAVWVRIDADCPDPHLRNGFDVPDLLGYVLAHRGELLHAVLTLCRAWVVEGAPRAGTPRHDSFGDWIRAISGLLEVVGIPGVFASVEVAKEASPVGSEDDEAAEFFRALLNRWPDGFQAREVVHTVKTVGEQSRQKEKHDGGDSWAVATHIDHLDLAVLDHLPEELVAKMHNPGFAKSLGRWLAYRVGQWKGGVVLRTHDARGGLAGYRVEEFRR